MPKHTAMEGGGDVDTDLPSKVSAFAVYKNLIPGVRAYEDHSTNGDVRSRKKSKKRNRNKKAVAIKPEVEVISPLSSESEPKKKKKKNKKRKLSLSESEKNGESDVTPSETSPSSVESYPRADKVAKKKNKKKQIESVPFDDSIVEPPKKKKKKFVIMDESPSPQKQGPVINGATSKKKQSIPRPLTPGVAPTRTSQRTVEFLFDSEPIYDSSGHGKEVFEWLIHPISTETFFAEHWEKKPLYLKRGTKNDYSWLLSSSMLDEIMRKHCIKFGKNIDITSYVDGVRETHNPEGRALPAVVWDYYSNGNSVRFLNPQTYIKPIWRLNASLQEYLGTFVGANVYLTPPDSQGFAPHYDDIEAFVIQVEGYKHWKLYKPRKKSEELPRFSSQNFNEEKDKLGNPILDVILRPGDLLYFPRGTIHQAKSIDGEHSLHITISAYQANTYGDFLSTHLPLALEQSIQNTLELRRGLPIDFLSYMGIVHSDSTEKVIIEKRDAFHKKIKKMTETILTKACDLAADQLGKKLIWDSLPPYFTSKEKRRSVYMDGEFIQEGTVLNRVEIGPDVEVKLVRRNACRLLLEEGTLRLYFNLQNSMEYHGEEPAYVDLPDKAGPAVEYLFAKYPEFVSIEDIPLDEQELKIQVCADLWEKGILLSRTPLSSYPFDETVGSEDDELEEPSDTSSSEEVSPEEEEDDEDRAFIDDENENNEHSVDDEPSEDDDDDEGSDEISFINDEAVEVEEESDDDEPPLLVKRKNVTKFKKGFIL